MDRVCPLLALAADRRTVVDGVDGGHRCLAVDPPAPLERDRQSRLCLTVGHHRCERYLAYLARGGVASGPLTVGDGLRSTRLLITPEPAWRGMAGRARRSSRGLALVGTVLAVGATGAAIAAAGALTSEGIADASPTPRPTPTLRATPEPTVRPTVTPAASVAATSTPTATPTVSPPGPTPAPTAAPTAAPTPQRTYVVQAGDTLGRIAQQFGTTVAAIQTANGIEDPNEIIVGDVLVIP